MPPEYIQYGHVSAKTDTYAYGVVLLELLTGRPPYDSTVREPLVDELAAELNEPERLLASWLDPLAFVLRRWIPHRLIIPARAESVNTVRVTTLGIPSTDSGVPIIYPAVIDG